ncbi:hypothetical protein [Streptomyces sp. AGS-58]|uniref:hypothetical protein n=1 Tax=unclassified Streptomyces TaxID=2593676 RepID=UPI0035A3A053
MSDLDQRETALRAALRRLGVRPAGHAPEADDGQGVDAVTPAPSTVPPRPDYAPTVGKPGPPRGGAPRLPDWRDPNKPALDAGDDAPEPAAAVATADSDDGPAGPPGTEDEPTEESARRRPSPPRAGKEPRAGHTGDPTEQGEDDGEDTGEDDQAAGEGPQQGRIGRWLRSRGETTRPSFATPAPQYHEPEKKSLAELVRELPPHKKWLLFAGSGFAAGWYFGIPQAARDATASIARHPGRLQDNPDAYFWGFVALVVVSLDRVTRRSWIGIAWTTRALTVSLVVGAWLHGNPLPH